VDLPRFRGGLRTWDQGIWSEGILLSCLKFDEGIVEDLVKEIAGDVRALPMMQFTLAKLWDERERNRITWDAYRKVGRPRNALKRTADSVFDGLSFSEQQAAEKLFLKLVEPAIGGNFSRRRVRRDVLYQLDSPDTVARVLERYVKAELIRQTPGVGWDDDHFNVAHEALVNSWPRLRDWLQTEREESEKRLQLIATARLWQESGFKSGYLISGAALDEAAGYTEAAPELKALVAASKEESRRLSEREVRIRNAVIFGMAILFVAAVWGWAKAILEANTARSNAEKSFKTVESVRDVILSQANRGDIRFAAAKQLLKPAGTIFDSIEHGRNWLQFAQIC
jgi:hypothetical protein